jgi:ribosomal protein L37E
MSEPTFTIDEKGGFKCITCHTCGMTSFHPQDILQKYCGKCHKFHEEPKEKPDG